MSNFNDTSLESLSPRITLLNINTCSWKLVSLSDIWLVCSFLSIGALMRRVFVLRTISMVFQSSLLTILEPSPLMKGEKQKYSRRQDDRQLLNWNPVSAWFFSSVCQVINRRWRYIIVIGVALLSYVHTNAFHLLLKKNWRSLIGAV